MPELPEMETYRRLLSTTVTHKPITNVDILREKTINTSVDEFTRRVGGRNIRNIRRKAKHILFDLDSGDVLLLHLMLGGLMYYGSPNDVPAHHSQVILTFGDGHQLFFQGLRLGYLHLYTDEGIEDKLSELGPELMDSTFDVDTFVTRMRHKRGPVKFALVDQHTLAGIGNCYSDEACFAAGLLPLTPVPDMSETAFASLYDSLHAVIRRAISFGGYMEFPFTKDDKHTGAYNAHCLVYDRGDEPCLRCGTPITETRYNRRKVFYCANCQH